MTYLVISVEPQLPLTSYVKETHTINMATSYVISTQERPKLNTLPTTPSLQYKLNLSHFYA